MLGQGQGLGVHPGPEGCGRASAERSESTQVALPLAASGGEEDEGLEMECLEVIINFLLAP